MMTPAVEWLEENWLDRKPENNIARQIVEVIDDRRHHYVAASWPEAGIDDNLNDLHPWWDADDIYGDTDDQISRFPPEYQSRGEGE